MTVTRFGVVSLLLAVTVVGCASAPGQFTSGASKPTARSAAPASTHEAVSQSQSVTSGSTMSSAALIPVTPLMRSWALVSVQVGDVTTAIGPDGQASLLLRRDGSSLMTGYCQGRAGQWAVADGGFVLTAQQDQVFSCTANGPSLMQLFSYGELAQLEGTVRAAVSDGTMIITAGSGGGGLVTMRFADQGPTGIPPPMVQPDTSGASPSTSPSSAAVTAPTTADALSTITSASQASPVGGDVVGVHWQLTRIDEAGVTTTVPAAAGEWLELFNDGHALGKFTSCEVNNARWAPTNSGMLTQFFQESDWPCPPNGIPVIHVFAGSRRSPVLSTRVGNDGDHLIVTAGPETLTFDRAGAATGAGVPQPQGDPGWVPLPPDQERTVDQTLLGMRWVLATIATGGQNITFNPSRSVDLDLYYDGSVGMTRLCTNRSSTWRPNGRQVEIISRHPDFSTCTTSPPPDVLTVGWPALTALIDAGPLTTMVTGSTLTIVHNNQTLTFHAATY